MQPTLIPLSFSSFSPLPSTHQKTELVSLIYNNGADRVYCGRPTGGFIEVDIDSLQLQIGIAVVGSGWVDPVLVRDYFPEFGADLNKENEGPG